MSFLQEIFFDYTLRTVISGSIILGLVSGILGSFAVLRKQSLLGDAISHAALPGVAMAFLLTHNKDPVILLTGAIVSGWLGNFLVILITRNTIIKHDAALGIILSVFFGFGLVLLTIIQKLPISNQAGLNKFLFGNASTLLQSDVTVMFLLGTFVTFFILIFWKEFKLLVFDHNYAQTLGYPVKGIELLLTTLIVVSIAIGLQMVGVVLMSAMLIAPAVAARQWTNKLGLMVMLSAFFGAISGVGGSVTSSVVAKLPTGPTIVLFASFIVLVSLLFAPSRGLVWEWFNNIRVRKKIKIEVVLNNLYQLSRSHQDIFHAHDIRSLTAIWKGDVENSIQKLLKRGFVKSVDGNRWALTPLGLSEAKKIESKHGGVVE